MKVGINLRDIKQILTESKQIKTFLDIAKQDDIKIIKNSFKNFDLDSFLDDMIKDFIKNPKDSDKIIQKIINLKLVKYFSDIKQNIKHLYTLTNNRILKKILIDIKKLNYKNLEQNIKNISNLYNTLKEIIKDKDITNNEVKQNANQILQKIEFFYFYSLLQNSFSSFLPFFWDILEDGYIEFKNNQNISSCKIDLDLENFGKIIIKLLYYDKKVSISFFIQNSNLKEKINSNIDILKDNLKKNNLSIFSIIVNDLENIQEDFQNELVEIYV